jgi:hypothetical protein
LLPLATESAFIEDLFCISVLGCIFKNVSKARELETHIIKNDIVKTVKKII